MYLFFIYHFLYINFLHIQQFKPDNYHKQSNSKNQKKCFYLKIAILIFAILLKMTNEDII